jgi:LemA protein
MNKPLVWILGIALLIGAFFVTTYNNLVGMSEAVDNQWAQVESQYQRRFDLIPNLVESVKGVMRQEQEVFKAIADARTRYAGSTGVDAKAAAATEVESAFARLLVIMENYPQLRSVETVTNLMSQLEGTENRISVERKRFNDLVRDFNVTIKRIPTNLIASMLGYRERAYFEAAVGSEVAPKVNLETAK